MNKVLIFGASGALGRACSDYAKESGSEVFESSRNYRQIPLNMTFDAVVWAQGKNITKPFLDTTELDWRDLIDANLLFIVNSLKHLISNSSLKNGCRLVVLGSVWESVNRSSKAAYIASKSGLSGLVRALSSELSPLGIAINCVAPGIVSTPMTNANLSKEQIERIKSGTPGEKLVERDEVAKVVYFLASPESSGINGQIITVDKGWSRHKDV